MLFIAALFAAIFLDQMFGDPRWLPHPVKIIGTCCNSLESLTRRIVKSPGVAGAVTALTVISITMVCTFILLKVLFSISVFLGYGGAILILYTTIAARDLVKHSEIVYSHLHPVQRIENARKSVAMIVGRDTTQLSGTEVSKACVETVAENMVDGVTAPLFYAVLGGLVSFWGIDHIGYAAIGAMTYKSINTMDSMFGYKNERYLHFGKVAARLDDVVNFIPARLTGLVLVPTAAFLRLDWKGSWVTLVEDRLSHASPNAGHPEAAVAGALGVQLGGDSSYFGKVVSKPTLGRKTRTIAAQDILITNKMMLLGSALFVCGLLLLKLLCKPLVM